MKKVLFATTALVLSAGVAAAEVSLSGDGRMGVKSVDDAINFSSRARVKFTLSGESDSGIAFGGSFRVDQEDENGASASKGGAGTVFVSGSFGRVEMGDAVGAPEALWGDFYEVGYTDLGDEEGRLGNDIAYLTGDSNLGIAGNENPVLLYTYSTGPISLAASFSDGKEGYTDQNDHQEMAVAAAYTWQNYTFGIGYEYADSNDAGNFVTGLYNYDAATNVVSADTANKMDQVELAFVGAFNDLNVKAVYGKGGKDNPVDNYFAIGADYTMDAWTFGGYVQYAELDDNTYFADGSDDVTWYGLGAEYDLGGGLSVKGGIADSNLDDTDVMYDLGMKFSF
ncbi:porin [Thioclava litoralis]|uniref:Porin n=1 Tax=Thioclava litoralis TaxID=3076557 RepID=A0ABZ1E568_9RHOB|nr:porin [Thioclava sp. FTW29]